MRLLALLLLVPIAAHAADSTSSHTLTLPGGPLAFTAQVETLTFKNAEDKPTVEIVTTAYTQPGERRPVTFALNGGPGSASAWLHVGALGPWRVPLAIPVIPSQDPTPVPNAETWLGFTDLVFIDPPGTGFSRALGREDALKPFLAVDADIQILATTIRRWLESHGRLAAPVFIAGESYGGFRAPRLARALLDRQGVGVSGLILISPVLDFNGRDAPYDLMRWVARLPSLGAAAHPGRSRTDLAGIEAYATGDYLTDLVRGPRDPAAIDRITTRVAEITGLDPGLVRRRQGRLGFDDVLRRDGRVASPYDATIAAQDPFPASANDNSPDPILDGLRAPVTSAVLQLYAGPLKWQPEGAPNRQYQLLNGQIAGQWDYGRGPSRTESMTDLRQYLALDPTARVLLQHGLTDLVTPYFASALLLAQVPETVPAGRLTLETYKGGHMPYTDQASRQQMQRDAAALIEAATSAHR